MKLAPIAAVLCALGPMHAYAQVTIPQTTTNKYHVTDEERAACQDDAVSLCSKSFPDEDMLLGCMKANRLQLTAICRAKFEAGLKRRHIPF